MTIDVNDLVTGVAGLPPEGISPEKQRYHLKIFLSTLLTVTPHVAGENALHYQLFHKEASQGDKVLGLNSSGRACE